MGDIILVTKEQNGLKYELVCNELDPSSFVAGEFSRAMTYHERAQVRITPVTHQTKQGT